MDRRQSQVESVDQFTARSLSLAEAGEALRVSRRTLYYWIKQGRLQTRRTPLGSQRVLIESVKAASDLYAPLAGEVVKVFHRSHTCSGGFQ